MYQSGTVTFKDAADYCSRCGRICRCSTTIQPIIISAIAGYSLPPDLFKVRLWMWAAARGPDPIPAVHLDQGVPSPRWREYQRRP